MTSVHLFLNLVSVYPLFVRKIMNLKLFVFAVKTMFYKFLINSFKKIKKYYFHIFLNKKHFKK